MDRLRTLITRDACEESDSIISSDFNWNDLSIGNDTNTCEKFFCKPTKYKQSIGEVYDNLSGVQFEFEDTAQDENNSNILNTPNAQDRSDTNFGRGEFLAPTAISPITPEPPRTYATVTAAAVTAINRPKVPNVVLAGKQYEQNRKMRMEKIEREEREKRQFHAKKVPNFNSIHAARAAKHADDEPKITVPITPRVVHNHRKNLERIRMKMQELEAARQPKPFIAKQPDVLTQPPFIPHYNKQMLTEPKPFHLHSDERVRERHQYDEQYKLEVQRREKEQEEKRKAEDEQIRRELRKRATFKARPNPFS